MRTAFVAIALMSWVWVTAANAEGYEFHARYRERLNSTKKAEVLLEPNDMIPRDTLDQEFEQVFIRIKTDNDSKAALAQFERLLLTPTCDADSCATRLEGAGQFPVEVRLDKDSYPDQPIFVAADVAGTAEPAHLGITTRSIFTRNFLCAQELKMRTNQGSPLTEEQQRDEVIKLLKTYTDKVSTDKQIAKATPEDFRALAILMQKGLTHSGKPLVYSFCPEIESRIDWKKAQEQSGRSDASGAEATRDEQARNLARLLADFLEKNKFGGVKINGETAADKIELFIESHQPFSIIRDITARLEFKERDNEGTHDLNGCVDKDSSLELFFTPDSFCSGTHPSCGELIDTYISVVIESTDNQGHLAQKDVKLKNQGRGWALEAALSDYLDKKISIVAIYNNNDHKFEISRRTTTVKNLGTVLSFPVVSEVISLVSRGQENAVNPKDDTFKSSIPLSYAFSLSGKQGQRLAITAPFMIGYNPRSSPDLAHLVRFFPHVSLIFPLGTDAAEATEPGPETAFGAGLAFVDTFALSWALSTRGNQYLMLGISIPDLAKIVH